MEREEGGKGRVACKYHASGYCKRGEQCAFRHEAGAWEGDQRRGHHGGGGRRQHHGGATVSSSSSSPSSPSAPPLCKYWRAGYCRDGTRCAYAHIAQDHHHHHHHRREKSGGSGEDEAEDDDDAMSCSSSDGDDDHEGGEDDTGMMLEGSVESDGKEGGHQRVVPYYLPGVLGQLLPWVQRQPGPARLLPIPAFEKRREQLESEGAPVRRVRVVCLSDTHMKHRLMTPFMPQGDDCILLHAGDFTALGRHEHVLDFNEWLGGLHYRHIFIVSGNHERVCGDVREHDAYASLLTNGTYVVNREVVLEEFGGLTLFLSSWERKHRDGTSAEPELFPWDHPSLQEEDAPRVDVLVTHMPPRRILDSVRLVKHRGSARLRERVERMKPRVHLFGHVHRGGVDANEHTMFINAANPGVAGPIVFDYYY